MNSKDLHDFSTKSVEELQEILKRYESLLRNKKVLDNLPDNGESIIKAREKVLNKLKLQECSHNLESSFSVMSLDISGKDFNVLKEKHVQHICELDKPFEDKRYRPHRTLISHKKINGNKVSSEVTDKEESTKRIPLAESLVIQTEQFQKAQEDKAKQFLLGFIKEDELKEPQIDIDLVAIDPEESDIIKITRDK